VWDEEGQRRLYSVVDVCKVLTEQPDQRGATLYWGRLKHRLKEERVEVLTNCQQLKLLAEDGKMRFTDVADAEQMLDLIQHIPSKKAGSFKKWFIGSVGGKADATDDPETATGLVIRTENAYVNGNFIERDNEPDFNEIVSIIERSRKNVIVYANRELIEMYWIIGEFVSKRINEGVWGKAVVEELAAYIQTKWPGIKGFSPQNIWRMKQFYETYHDNKFLSPLVREIGWTNNVIIMMAAKTDEAREFYLNLAKRYNYTKRDLERQINSGLFERQTISDEVNRPLIEGDPGLSALRDSYILEFLRLPEKHEEKDLRKAIVANMHSFLLEFGKEFMFVDEEFRIKIGNRTFRIDLLFYNRSLSCYVAIELKTEDFRPAYLGQMKFYLDALDKDVKRPEDNPSVGLVLCAGKDRAVVEYALNKNMTPALIAEYRTHLPDKSLLESRLRELRERALAREGGDSEG